MSELTNHPKIKVTRVQTGVRIEKRMLKVLKALAEYYDISLGDLVEAIVLHSVSVGVHEMHSITSVVRPITGNQVIHTPNIVNCVKLP